MSFSHLEQIAAVSESILQRCACPPSARPLTLVGLKPNLHIPEERWFIPSQENATIIADRSLFRAISLDIQDHLTTKRDEFFARYDATVHGLVSAELYGGLSDKQMEMDLCGLFENKFSRYCSQVRQTLRSTIHRVDAKGTAQHDIKKRVASFTDQTIKILEAAYSRTKILSAAETAIIAKAAGITPHQVRTWFQNKRNRGSKRNPSSSANRPIQTLPKRAQQIKLETSPFSSSLVPIKRQVRGLPKRAQAQVSHNAPNSSILGSSLGNLPFSDESPSIGHGQPSHLENGNGERMNRSPSLTSTISNSSEISNGGFVSPFDAQNIPQIAIEWGTGILNVPVDVLEGGRLPIFNFTPPSPLNLNFNPVFNPDSNSFSNDMKSMFGGQVYDTPTSTLSSFNPFAQQPNLDSAAGLESIESLLSSALSDPSSFEQFSTLAASPQISIDSLSPTSDTLESIPSIVSASGSNIGSPSWLAGNGEEGLDGGFFEALEGLLASQNNSEGALGSPFSESVYGGNTERKASTSSQVSGIISAEEGIDLSYIAGIPLPSSPTNESFDLAEFDVIAGPSFSHNKQITFTNDTASSSFTENDFLTRPPSGMCTPPSTTSVYPLITPTNTSESNQESLVEIDQSQWSWMSGVLPFDMVGMEVEMMELGNDTKVNGEEGWLMDSSNGEEMMAL
ncbi:hypothetical protein I203_102419 [Kwoniella mangroviensis CBS 8507]|uniref:uncharacterized protein n=1 Tax=Kwoniella mangroviensis CBS 8507 TaxID=1296122 RepID=UPI00307289C0